MNRRDLGLLAAAGLISATGDARARAGTTFKGGSYFFSGQGQTTSSRSIFDPRGVPTDALWAASNIGESIMTFRSDGTGFCKGRTVSKISTVYDPSLKANYDLLATEVREWGYDYSYSIDNNNRLLIYIGQDSWKGRIIGGSRAGNQFSVHYLLTKPALDGFLSEDLSSIQLLTREPVLYTNAVTGGSPLEYINAMFSVTGTRLSKAG